MASSLNDEPAQPKGGREVNRKLLYCWFCGKNHEQVAKMIAGPEGVCICDECVDVCNEVISAPSDGDAEYLSWATPPVNLDQGERHEQG